MGQPSRDVVAHWRAGACHGASLPHPNLVAAATSVKHASCLQLLLVALVLPAGGLLQQLEQVCEGLVVREGLVLPQHREIVC